MLTAVRYHGSDGQKSVWVVRCDCGREILMDPGELLKERQRSCGCSRNKFISEKNTTHGMSHHPAYAVWRSMLARCNNPRHKAYHNYGGRGITVCPDWRESFENFWRDAESLYKPGLWIERIDNNGDYEPLNIEWATPKKQCRNTRKNRLIPTPQGVLPLWRAAEISGIGHTTLYHRFQVGCPPEKMFDKPDPKNRYTT